MFRIIRDLLGFVWHKKKFWMIPLILALVIVGGLIVFGEASPLSPFIYSMF